MKTYKIVKESMVLAVVLAAVALFSGGAFAAEANEISNVSISLQNIFSLEFYTDSKVIYSEVVPFTNVDPAKSVVYPDGRSENDGKSDVGLLAKCNIGAPWYLKAQLTPGVNLAAEKLRFYVDQPYNRNTGGRADGTLARPANWYSFTTASETVYISGPTDQSNLPFGTLTTFNYSLIPSGLDAGTAYSAVITYTMTTAA